MASKPPIPPIISLAEFKLCLRLNTRPGHESNPDLDEAMHLVLVKGLSQAEARKEFPHLTKQSLYNALARMNAQYVSRIATLTADQFEFGVSVVCPDISARAKTLAKAHLGDPASESPTGSSDTAQEARLAIEMLRSFHLKTLLAYTPH